MAIERPVDEVLAAPLVEAPAEDPLVEAPADDAAASDTVKTPPAMSETARDDGVRALVAAMRDVDVGAADAASLRPRLEALDAAAAGAVAAPQLRDLEAFCLADARARDWTTARVQWMSGRRTSHGLVALRLRLAALASQLRCGGGAFVGVGAATFEAVAAGALASLGAFYGSLAPLRVLCDQWVRDATHAAATALGAVALLRGAAPAAALDAVLAGDGRAPEAAARALLHVVALVAAPAREVAAALRASTPKQPTRTKLALAVPALGDAAAPTRTDAPTEALDVDWARLLTAPILDACGLADALVPRRPELLDEDFPPLDDTQKEDAGVLRAFFIHRRCADGPEASDVAAPAPPRPPALDEPPAFDALAVSTDRPPAESALCASA